MRASTMLLAAALLLSGAAAAQNYDPEKEREAETLLREGLALMEAGKVDAALQRLAESKAVLARNRIPAPPWAVQVPYNMARCEFQLGMTTRNQSRIERAKELLGEAERIDPRFGGTFFFWGVIGSETKSYRDAVLGFEQALKRGWQVRLSRANLAQAMFFYGVEKFREPHSSNEDVIRIFQHAMDRLEVLKGEVEYYSSAERDNFRKLWIDSITNLAAVRQRANDLPQAELLLKRLIDLQPKNHHHYFNLGKVYGTSQKWDLAMTHYEKSLEISGDPSFLEPLPMMAYIRSQQKRPAEAEKYFLAFLEQNPDHWWCNYEFAEHLNREKQLDRAEKLYRRCIELNRNLFRAMYKLAGVLRVQKKLVRANKWLRLYQRLDAGQKDEKEAGDPESGEDAGKKEADEGK